MNMRDLIPWTRSQDLLPEYFRDERSSPFLTLHREMNRLLEEAFRGFASTSLAARRTEFVNPAWPKLEVQADDFIRVQLLLIDGRWFIVGSHRLVLRGGFYPSRLFLAR